MKVKCTVCGEIFDDSLGACPVCGAGLDKCVPYVEGEGKVWATEHKLGEGASCGDIEIVEGLRVNFNGECKEVGMYLAMARVADREGYPEVAEAFTRIAFEEAGHAARFAELLGECLTNSTEENLRRRGDAEYSANSGKYDLAKRAKKLGFDAIHDSVHEMAKDEARHGKVFLGLLERYFETKK